MMKIIYFSTFLIFISNCVVICEKENIFDDNGMIFRGSSVLDNSRYKRTAKDVEELVKDDLIMAYLVCEICVLKENCMKPYCQYCNKCANTEKKEEEENSCMFCSSIDCRNKRLCRSCSICQQENQLY